MHFYPDQSRISEFLHHSLMMNKDNIQVTSKILSLTLEIIFLLTGEDFVLTKKQDDQAAEAKTSRVSETASRSPSPLSQPPSCSLPGEVEEKTPDNSALVGTEKVPVRCEDVAVYLSMEEWEYLEGHKEHYRDFIVERRQPVISEGVDVAHSAGSPEEEEREVCAGDPQEPEPETISQDPFTGERSSTSAPERCKTPEGVEEEDGMMPEDDQVKPMDETISLQCKEEVIAVEISSGECCSTSATDPSEASHYPPDAIEEENRIIPKDDQMEPEAALFLPQCKEEAVPADISPGLSAAWIIQPDSSHLLPPVQLQPHKGPPSNIPLLHILSENPSNDVLREPESVLDKAPTLKRQLHFTDMFKKHSRVDPSSVSFMTHGEGSQNVQKPPEKLHSLLYKCRQCRRTFSSEFELVSHQRTHGPERAFSCTQCPQRFTDRTTLLAHQWALHRPGLVTINPQQRPTPEEKPFACSECGRSFTKKSTLVKHQRIHTGAFACPDCGKCLSDKTGLILHRRTHTGEKPFACSECGRRFTQMCHLVTHQSVHTGERPFACSECGKCFSIRSVLTAHQAIHARHKMFACPECGKAFTQKAALATHRRIHSGELGSTS